MNTQTMHGLAKILLALSVLYLSFGVLTIVIPLSTLLGLRTVQGVHSGDLEWLGWIRFAIMFVLIGAVLFCCHLFSRRARRGLLATVLLWAATLVGGVYAAMLLFGLLREIIQATVAWFPGWAAVIQ